MGRWPKREPYLAGRLVRELGIAQAEAAGLLEVTTPAMAKTLKRAGMK